MYSILIIFVFLGKWQPAFSQSSILDKYVSEALENNLNIASEFLKKEKQSSRIEQAKRLKRPQLDMDASYLLAKGGRTLNFPIGDLFNPVNGTLNQLTGGNQFPTDLENVNTQLTPNNFIDLQLSVSKPIINSSIKYNRLIQNELIKLNDLDIALSKEEIEEQVKIGYYNYLKTFEGLAIMEESEKLLNDVLIFNKKLIKYDKATPDILSDVEFQIANLNSQRAMLMEQQQLAKAYFNLLLNKDLTSEIEIDENILNRKTEIFNDLQSLKNNAFTNRMEFQKIEVGNAVNILNQKRIDKEKLPTLGVSAGIGLQTENFNFDMGGPLFTLGLGMNWNILDGGLRKKKVEEIEIDKRILNIDRERLKQQIEIEITQIYFKIQSLAIQMQSEEVAVKSARKSYQTIKKRYENDKAILIELIQAQNNLTRTELSRSLTKYDYLIQLAALEKAQGLK